MEILIVMNFLLLWCLYYKRYCDQFFELIALILVTLIFNCSQIVFWGGNFFTASLVVNLLSLVTTIFISSNFEKVYEKLTEFLLLDNRYVMYMVPVKVLYGSLFLFSFSQLLVSIYRILL